MTETLEEWREAIEKEVPFVDVKPYSHNIISVSLQAISRLFGQKEANRAIEDYGLESLGWHKKGML